MVSSSHFWRHSDSPGSSHVNAPNHRGGGSFELGLGERALSNPHSPHLCDSYSRIGELVPSSTSSFLEAELASKSKDDGASSESLLKYIHQVLMEEGPEDRLSLYHDFPALRATEKSLYDVIAPNKMHGASSTVRSNSNNTSLAFHGDYRPLFPNSAQQSGSWPNSRSSLISFSFANNPDDNVVRTSSDKFTIGYHSDTHESAFCFRKGSDDAHRSLSQSIQLIADIEKTNEEAERLEAAGNRNMGVKRLPKSSKGRKNHVGEDTDRYLKEERINKQVAFSMEEADLSELFDRLLLCEEDEEKPHLLYADERCSETGTRFRGSRSRAKKRDMKEEHAVDLRNLLILCAEAVSANDYRTANKLLAQIRQHSSPLGDWVQRLSHYFANGLEARLSGSVVRNPDAYCLSMNVSLSDMLRFYQTIFQGCPFSKISISFANNAIARVAEKAKVLHVVDFGILHGFQWPILIQLLSRRQGGPPKLRITGIEIPKQGFRPSERINETGTQLARCCERLGVPFEYHGIASEKWETIKIDELKLDLNEVLAVNCLFRFKNLLDETVAENNPRDAVLQLIQEMRPDVFVQSVVNGSYNSPFFITRFKEALYHFSVLFDMIDANVPRESTERMFIEGEFYGWEMMNVIACESSERVERPETYKQWQKRITRAGFEQLPLDQELLRIYRTKLKQLPDKNFMIDEDGKWLLQGYKGRIIYASSCWKPV